MADPLTSELEESEISQFIQHKYSCCNLCGGFYGPNFGEPVCSTCHMFLFPTDINLSEEGVGLAEMSMKADSGDSGNEEPNAEDDFYVKQEARRNAAAGHKQYVPIAPKADKIAERINVLSSPRDYQKEKVPDGLVDSMPPEVLLGVFFYLDDISLWCAGNVCSRWRQILDAATTQDKWKRFISRRWPLFHPQYRVKCWRTIYTKLLESAPCIYCLEGMMLQSTLPIEENSWRHRRLRSELKTLRTDPPEGIQAIPLDRHCCHWQASITGPQGSPYEGGLFFLYLQIPQSYPMRPPVVRFITRIFHPNISRHGDVGLDSIHHNWSLALTISKVLISIQSLLTDPYCHVCMEPDIGKIYFKQRPEFERLAKLWTWNYAMHDYLMPTSIKLR